MSYPVLERSSAEKQAEAGRRHHQPSEDALVLTELKLDSVVDLPGDQSVACELVSFGNIRETCPKCSDVHLKLILRQSNVRQAHLLCVQCDSCFDAHYPDGSPALTI